MKLNVVKVTEVYPMNKKNNEAVTERNMHKNQTLNERSIKAKELYEKY